MFRDEVVVGRLFVDIVKTDDMFMFEFVEYIDFILECNFVFFGEFGFGNDLDGVVFVGAAFGGFDDYGEGSFAKLMGLVVEQ